MVQLGFITMAFGNAKHLRQAETLARSIRRNMPGYPIAVVTDRPSTISGFDIVVPMPPVAQAGTVHKVDLYHYSPFDETLFIDADSVVTRNFGRELSEIRRYDFTPIIGHYLTAGDHNAFLDDVGKAIAAVGGSSYPTFNGGLYFFRKGERAQEIFRRAADMRLRAGELGIRNFDKSGPGEETLIGLALSSLRCNDLYHDGGRLMRTPIQSRGRIVADPMTQVCHFEKEGRRVEPAIIHYCGDWIEHPSYRIAERALARGASLPRVEKMVLTAACRVSRFRKAARRKARGAANRLRRLALAS